MANSLRRLWRQQRGSLAVETALALPILLAAGALFADLVTVQLTRERLEQRAGAIVSVLAMQSELTRQGLAGLLDATLPDGEAGNYQLTISNVRQNGNVYWQLNRGNATAICENQAVPGDLYPGDLPEVDADNGKENVSMMVVELCREGPDLGLLGGLSLTKTLHVSAVNRLTRSTLQLDDTLAAEAGLEEADD